MANTLSEALLVLTSWNAASDDLTSQPTRTLVKDFRENTLKSDLVSKLYSTVLDVEVSEDQKKDAESVGVTLIPATRSKWAKPKEDPPGLHWLFNHNTYYRQLKDLQNVKHVVSFSPKTENAAAAIHESLFPQAQLHQLSVPTPPGVVFAFDAWSRDACGLTGYNRAIIQDFIARKSDSGEYLKAYSSVVDVELSADQIEDAEKCGVTLIKAERKKGVNEMPKIEWLINHESYFPDLGRLENIKYVVGYAPKTGWAAVEIRKKLFPNAKLALINHVCHEKICLLIKDEFSNFEQEMLQMASEADILFSIGPHTFNSFQRAYRAEINGRKLYDIPHKEILPKPRQKYFDHERPETDIEIDGHSILTYGQLNTEEALKRCDSIAASIGSAANKYKDFLKKPLEWKIQGVSEQAYTSTKKFLFGKLQSSHVTPKPYKCNSADSLLQSLQQSDLCLPPSCYTDYSFEGLEAMAAGLPTTVQDDSHIAAMIERHFEHHKDYCVVRKDRKKLTSKIITNLKTNNVAVQQAKLLQEALAESEAVTESLARFASSLTEEDAETQNSTENKTTAVQPEATASEDRGTTETTAVQLEDTAREDRETTESTAVQLEATATEDRGTEITAAQPEATAREDRGTTESTAVQPEATVREDRETTESTAVQLEATAREDRGTETTAVQPEATAREDRETTESTAVQLEATAREDRGTESTAVQPEATAREDRGTESTAVQPEASAREDRGTTESTALQPEVAAMQPGKSVIDDKETGKTITVHAVRSGTEDMEITEARTVQSGISIVEGMEKSEITTVQTRALTEGFKTTTVSAVQHEMSSTEGTETADTKVVQPGMSNTKDLDTTARSGTTMPSEMSVVEGVDITKHTTVQDEVQEETDNLDSIRQGLITRDKNNDRNSKRFAIPRHEDCRKSTGKNKHRQPKMLKKEHRRGGKMKSSGFDKSGQKESEAVKHKVLTTGSVSRNPGPPSPSPQSVATGSDRDSTDIVVSIGLITESYEQHMNDLKDLVHTKSFRKKKKKLKTKWKKCKAEFEKNSNEVIANEESRQTVRFNFTEHLGQVKVKSITKNSLAIHLNLLTLRNLNRLKHTCQSGSFPDSFEPLLITDKMREEADKVELQLKLKATYDQARFDELELLLENNPTEFVVCIGLNEEFYEHQMKDLDKQEPTSSVREEKEKLNITWEECNGDFEKNVNEVITNEEKQQTVSKNCKEHFGNIKVNDAQNGSLAIHMDLPTVYNLYRLEHTCQSGSFPDSFEPLLITDKMREEADKVGLQLKLKATYDQARFRKIERFFMNRDGGGLKPVKVYDDVIEGKDAEEIHIDDEDTDQKSDTVITGRVDNISQRQSLEDTQSKSEMERATLESQLKAEKEEMATLEERCKELTQKLESTEQSLVSHRIGSSTERDKLQSELKENQKLIRELENTVEELLLTLEQSELKKPAEEDPTSMPQQPPQHHHEMSTGHMMLASAATGPPTTPGGYYQAQQMPYQTAQPRSQGTIIGQMRPDQHIQYQPNIEYTQKPQMYIPPSQGQFTSPYYQGQNPLPQEIQTSATQVYAPSLLPQQPPQHHHQMSAGHMMQAFPATGPPNSPVVYSQAQQMPYPTDQSHAQGTIMGQMIPQHMQYQPSMQPQMYRSPPQGHLTSPYHQGQNLIPQDNQSSATQVYDDWSVTLVSGQHQGRGQKFKLPCGLAFHRDKLVVCDSGNNIVQILNKDYTCDKVIGSFDGQFAKPFQPWSVAISRFNHYFILDGENKQIVVCDENGKIIQIITLPENIKVVWDIALMDDFVLVTLSLTSLDITRREDRDDRLVKYTQSGEYVTEVSGQTSVQTKFYYPDSVAVNSKNVIMVYDRGNECIKCFDSDLNFLHQFGQSQLQTPRTGSVIDGWGSIAVDEDDNVYVCGYFRVKSTGDVIREFIVKYGCDGKFICDLFKGCVSLPLYIAVMGDKIGVVEAGSDQIKVFGSR